MNHQPYEDMLLDERELSIKEKDSLTQHLLECPQCAKLEKSLRVLDHEFRSTPVVAPAPGFSERWKTSLPERRKQHERQQTRIILISMAVTAVATGITLAVFLFPPISPISIFANILSGLLMLVNTVIDFWVFVGAFLQAAPKGLSIGLVLSVTTWISIILLAWGISMYKITLKGVKVEQ